MVLLRYSGLMGDYFSNLSLVFQAKGLEISLGLHMIDIFIHQSHTRYLVSVNFYLNYIYMLP